MHRNFKIADSVTAGQVAHRVPGKKQDGSGFAGCIAHVAQGALLVCRETVFQKIDVIGHSVSCFRLDFHSQVPDAVALTVGSSIGCKPYLNTSRPGLLCSSAPNLRLFPFPATISSL